MIDTCKWVGFATSIEDDQSNSNLIEIQLVDNTITRLACEIPEQCLAGHGSFAIYVDVLTV
jgi:hypothetical protein